MQPVFEQLARRLEEYDFVLGEVNAYENKVLTAKQKVKGYPTLILYKNGKPNGFPQSTDSVLYLFEYALQHAYGLVTYMTTQKEVSFFWNPLDRPLHQALQHRRRMLHHG